MKADEATFSTMGNLHLRHEPTVKLNQ